MIAWDALKAASSLAVGTAWQLLTSPKTGGAGVVMNDGVRAELADSPIIAQLAADPIEAVFAVDPFACELAPQILASIADSPIHVEISP